MILAEKLKLGGREGKTVTLVANSDFGAVLSPSAVQSVPNRGLLIIGVVAEYTGTGAITGVTVDGFPATLVGVISEAGASSNSLSVAMYSYPITAGGNKTVAASHSATPQRSRITSYIARGLRSQTPIASGTYSRAPNLSESVQFIPPNNPLESIRVFISGDANGSSSHGITDTTPGNTFDSQINAGDTRGFGDATIFPRSAIFTAGTFTWGTSSTAERRSFVNAWWV